jgi:gluconate 2-dehydrogenase gamma chain
MKLAIRPARIIKGNVPMLKFLSVKQSSDSRRTFLRKSVALVPIASIAGCDLASTTPSATVAGTGTPTTQASASTYIPVFFDAKEWAFVSAAVDRLIPADTNGPGQSLRAFPNSSTAR